MAFASKYFLLLAILLFVATPRMAAACEYIDDSVVYDVLGVSDRLRFQENVDLQLPRNVAFVFFQRDSGRPQLLAAGAPVELELLGVEPEKGDHGLQTAVEPLVPGVTYTYDGIGEFTVADYIDTQAPQPATVREASLSVSDHEGVCGFSGSSCGSSVSVRARLDPGTDDHTPPERLTYAIYLGVSPRAVLATPQVGRYMVLDEGSELSTHAAFEWSEGDVFLSIATLDQAGNESARTDPVQIHRASGCRVRGASGLGSFVWIVAAIAWHVLRRRKQLA